MLFRRKLSISLASLFSIVLIFHQLSAQVPDSVKNVPSISKVIVNDDSVIVTGDMHSDGSSGEKAIVLNHSGNNLAFIVEPEGIYEYRFFLKGFDRKPTHWQKAVYKEYTNLPAGRYSLHVMFRGPEMKIGETAPLYIKVKPFWFLTGLAKTVYIFLFLLTLLGFYRLLKHKFERRQYILEQTIKKKNEDLMAENEKSGKLLANVLPKVTADEIMEKGKATKTKFNFVTVLFSDIQGFTQIAEEMNPEILIDELDKFFFHFDTVVEKYRIEKIKTIGDAYMCAGGIPEKNRTNPVEVILAALEMQEYMKQLKESSKLKGMKYWDIRIGIHTGTVIAGVVGHKKLSYDIWGDTVNTASRMESSGEAGRVNISGTTYEFVKDFFVFEYRGKMPVKYKGELEMYFVNGIIDGLKDATGAPNSRFRFKMQLIKLQDVEEMVDKMFTDEAPPNLYFHNAALARNITSQVDLITIAENLPEQDYLSLKLASIFVITGYITDYDDPVEAALRCMDELLPNYGFEADYINAAKKLIRNSFDGSYETLSDKILHDAVYDYLGRVDYLRISEKLIKEKKEHGLNMGQDDWKALQKRLLKDHDFLTGTGKLLRSVTIREQVAALESSVS